MFNSGTHINTKIATEIINKSKTHCNLVLKRLKDKDLIVWHGSSPRDKTQYYTLKI